MKLHSLSDLGSIYGNIAESNKNEPAIPNEAKQADILLTDATQYVPVKAGSPLGGGPGAKGDEVKFAKKTGPEAADNFKKVDDKADPGSDKEEMEEVVNNEDGDEKNEKGETSHDAAKNTTPKEKVEKIVAEEHKYNYKPKFNMSKPKFDQLYEAALKRVPFTESDDNMGAADEAAAPEDMGVPSATDAAADAEGSTEESNDVTITLSKELAEKLHDALMAVLAKDEEQADEESEHEVEAGPEDVMAEDVEAEDEGHPLHNLKKGKPDAVNKPVVVGDIKKSGGTADKGKIKNEPEPKEEKGDNAALQGKNNKVGSGTVATAGKKIFD